MNSKRNKNIRKACDEINYIIENIKFQPFRCLDKENSETIKKLLHRIKRTTWRGNEKKKVNDGTWY